MPIFLSRTGRYTLTILHSIGRITGNSYMWQPGFRRSSVHSKSEDFWTCRLLRNYRSHLAASPLASEFTWRHSSDDQWQLGSPETGSQPVFRKPLRVDLRK